MIPACSGQHADFERPPRRSYLDNEDEDGIFRVVDGGVGAFQYASLRSGSQRTQRGRRCHGRRHHSGDYLGRRDGWSGRHLRRNRTV